MNHKTAVFLLEGIAGAILLLSCNPKKTDNREAIPTEQAENAVRSLPLYAYTDSLMQGSHQVVYRTTSETADELPVVEDEDGTKYKDNRYNLLVTKDGQTLFQRSFTKADFKSQLSSDFQKYGIMDGLRFNHIEDGKLIFNTCVSFPDSDMSCPFILAIGPDGSYTISPDTSIDEELPSI